VGWCNATALRVTALIGVTNFVAEIIKLCDIADTLAVRSQRKEGCMKLAGFLLLLAGWAIVVASVVLLLAANARAIFILAGFGVEIVGLTLVIRSNPLAVGDRE